MDREVNVSRLVSLGGAGTSSTVLSAGILLAYTVLVSGLVRGKKLRECSSRWKQEACCKGAAVIVGDVETAATRVSEVARNTTVL